MNSAVSKLNWLTVNNLLLKEKKAIMYNLYFQILHKIVLGIHVILGLVCKTIVFLRITLGAKLQRGCQVSRLSSAVGILDQFDILPTSKLRD